MTGAWLLAAAVFVTWGAVRRHGRQLLVDVFYISK